MDLTGDSDEDFSDYEDEFYDSFSESDDGEEDEEEPEAVRDSDRDCESDPRIERGLSDSGETSAPLSNALSDLAQGLPFYTPSLEEKVNDLFNGVDPAGLGNPALVQQFSDYLLRELGFSESEAQDLAQEFADALQQASEEDLELDDDGEDLDDLDPFSTGPDPADAGSAPSTRTTGNGGIPDRNQGQINDDPAFFWGTVAGLWSIVSGVGGAAIGALMWLGTALTEALSALGAWAGVAVYNPGQRIGSLWQSVLRFFGAESPDVEGEGAAVVEDAAALANRLHHIFDKSEHALDSLVEQFGSQLEAYNAVQKAANQALQDGQLTANAQGILPKVGAIIDVGGTQVRLIGGRVVDGVVDGVVKISSFSRQGL